LGEVANIVDVRKGGKGDFRLQIGDRQNRLNCQTGRTDIGQRTGLLEN
jgi:hypothetical protein